MGIEPRSLWVMLDPHHTSHDLLDELAAIIPKTPPRLGSDKVVKTNVRLQLIDCCNQNLLRSVCY